VPSTPSGLRVAVVTFQDPQKSNSLSYDVELVRSAILYADHVEVVSLVGMLFASVLSAKAQLSQLSMLTALISKPQLKVLRPLLQSVTGKLRGARGDALERMAGEILSELELDLRESGGDELIAGAAAGVVTTRDWVSAPGSVSSSPERWLEVLRDLLSDPYEHVLLGDQVDVVVKALVEDGTISPGILAMKHAGEAAVGSGLIARLPAFPQAPLSELLDVRSDLSSSLARYRTATVRLSSQLQARSFDPEIRAEIDDLWINEVAPVLAELEELFFQHTLIREIARTTGKDLKTLIIEGAALFTAVTATHVLGAVVAASVAAAAPALQAAVDGTLRVSRNRRAAERNDLFFLYEAQRRLSRSQR
jgi:hypothetical protein